MRKYTVIIFSLLSLFTYSQDRNSNWCFGDSAGINFSNAASPVPISSSIDARGSCVSISDTVGNLLFYGSTFYRFLYQQAIHQLTVIYNSSGQIMDNGDTIIGEGWYQELLIVPMPDSPNLYYLFSIGSGIAQIGLYYNIIDMSQNGGLGKVIIKNVLLNSYDPFDGITAVMHGNGRDWWLIFKLDGYSNGSNNVFYNYLISPSGISSPLIDSIGTITLSDAGHLAFSKDGNKLSISTWNNLLEILNFDRCTGHFSNPNIIELENHSLPGAIWSTCFSANGNALYRITNLVGASQDIGYLIQYDLSASNISTSKDTLYTFNAPEIPGGLQRGPDDKIYLSIDYGNYFFYPDSIRNNINENLSVINRPDSLGDSCLFAPYSFYLGGKRTYYGLPNNPDYEMGPLIGSGCDSLVGVQSKEYEVQRQELHVFFHPGWQGAFVNAEGLKGKNYSLHVYDLTGREVFKEEGKLNGAYYTKDLRCEGFANGLYIVNLRTEKEVLSKKFIKQ